MKIRLGLGALLGAMVFAGQAGAVVTVSVGDRPEEPGALLIGVGPLVPFSTDVWGFIRYSRPNSAVARNEAYLEAVTGEVYSPLRAKNGLGIGPMISLITDNFWVTFGLDMTKELDERNAIKIGPMDYVNAKVSYEGYHVGLFFPLVNDYPSKLQKSDRKLRSFFGVGVTHHGVLVLADYDVYDIDPATTTDPDYPAITQEVEEYLSSWGVAVAGYITYFPWIKKEDSLLKGIGLQLNGNYSSALGGSGGLSLGLMTTL